MMSNIKDFRVENGCYDFGLRCEAEYCCRMGEKIKDLYIAVSSNSNGFVYNVEFLCSRECYGGKRSLKDMYIVNDKTGIIKTLRDILKNDLNYDDRRFIQVLLLRVNRNQGLGNSYKNDELIPPSKTGAHWCYICKSYVPSTISEKNFEKDDYGYIIQDLRRDERIEYRQCDICNTEIIYKL